MAGKTDTINPSSRSMLYADRDKMNIKFEQKLKRNVLEIKVEKDNAEDEMIMSKDIIANLLCKLNINIKLHVEGYQAQMNMKIL